MHCNCVKYGQVRKSKFLMLSPSRKIRRNSVKLMLGKCKTRGKKINYTAHSQLVKLSNAYIRSSAGPKERESIVWGGTPQVLRRQSQAGLSPSPKAKKGSGCAAPTQPCPAGWVGEHWTNKTKRGCQSTYLPSCPALLLNEDGSGLSESMPLPSSTPCISHSWK